MRSFKALSVVSLLALTTALAAPATVAFAQAAPVAQQQATDSGTLRRSRIDWAQAASDLAPDPAVRFGTLPNGMRYAILHNATPPGQASLRLRIDAGSLMEQDDQLGLAHFMEHMAFNGTARVPEGDLLPLLERLGLAFGPDTNAFTSFDQTVYQLDLPRTDDETVGTALMVLRDMAGQAALAADAIDRERGIVLSEERTRASPGLRMALANYDFLLRGQLAPRRFPIGDPHILSTAPRERFAAFYEAYYRPERATLIAVGDFDVDQMEARVRAEFGNWANAAPNGPEPDLGPVAAREPEAFVFSEPGVQPTVELAWVAPMDHLPDTRANRARDLVRSLGWSVFNRRLQRLARGEAPPFVSASGSRGSVIDSQEQVSLSAAYRPGEWAQALAAIEQERRRMLDFGMTDEELAREITEYRTAYAAFVAGAATRRTPALADSLTSSVHDQAVFTAPADDLARFEQAIAGLTPDAVMAELRRDMQGDGPLVFLSSPEPVEGGADAVMAALRQSQATPVQATAASAGQAWPYTDFGPAGQVVDRALIEDIGVTTVRFANGVRLTLKPTDFRDDQVLVTASFAGGRLSLPNDRVLPMWGAASALIEGGLARISREDMEAVLAGDVVSTAFGLADERLALNAATRPEDLEVQLQALAAYATDAAFRPQAFERVRTAYLAAIDQIRATPAGAFGVDAGQLIHGGDLRWAFPTRDQLASARLSDLQGLIAPALARAPIEIVIVGDFETEAAIAAVASTFGALPARGEAAPSHAEVRFPAGEPEVVLTHAGRADQGLGFLAWATEDAPSDVYRARTLNVLAAVLQLRLTEELREGQAVTYSPSASSNPSWDIPGYGYLAATMEAPPEALDGFFADVERIAAALRDAPVSADELERARRPLVEAIQRNRSGNEYWLGNLEGLQTEPTRLGAIRSVVGDLERVTPQDLQAAARAYLVPARLWRVRVVPQPAQ